MPYWTLESGWESHLELRNNLLKEWLTVHPSLRNAAGEEFDLPGETLAPDEVRMVDLRDEAATAAPALLDLPGSFGAVVLRFTSYHAGNLLAGVMIQRDGQPIEFHVDGAASDSAYTIGSLESLWWLPRESANGYLVLSNTSSKPLNVTMAFSQASGQGGSQQVTLAPYQTGRLALNETVRAMGLKGEAGGLRLTVDGGGANALQAAEVFFDETTGFSAMMKVVPRYPADMAAAHTLRAPNVALATPDPVLAFPSGTALKPYLLLRNTSPAALAPSIQLTWRGVSGAALSGLATLSVPIAPLQAGETRVVDLSKIAGLPRGASWAAVSISYSGKSGDLVAEAASFDPSGRWGAQCPFSEGLAAKWRGSMWQADATHDTLLTVANVGSKPARARLILAYNAGAGAYQLPDRTLQPGEQMWVDVGELVRGQLPDAEGHVLPPDAAFGSFRVRDEANPVVGHLYVGELLIDNGPEGHVHPLCTECCGYTTVTLTLDANFAAPGQGVGSAAWGNNQCDGMEDVTSYCTGWWSTNTGVATVDQYGNVTCVGVGTCNIECSVLLEGIKPPSCPSKTFTPSSGMTGVTLSQSPSSLNMSTGDNPSFTVTVSPNNVPVTLSFNGTSTPTSNPNSQGAVTLTVSGSGSGQVSCNVKASPAGNSGVYSVTATVGSATSTNSTTVNIPPQILIQMMYAEAQGQNDSCREALGLAFRNRMGDCTYFSCVSSYQNAIPGQAQYNQGITTGVENYLDDSVAVWFGTLGDFTGGSGCFWSPTYAQWQTVQSALNSRTTTFPAGIGDPGCYKTVSGYGPQIIYDSSVGTSTRGGSYAGAPAFLFERKRNITGTVPPAVVQLN